MEKFNKEIKQILGEETPVPEVVQKKAEEAFRNIQEQKVTQIRGAKNRQQKTGKTVFKVAASFAVACLLCTTAMAATGQISLLSDFREESPEVQKKAEELRDQSVEQTGAENEGISQWVNFRIREAICDKNSVRVLVEAVPVDAERYLLVPSAGDIDTMVIENLHIKGESVSLFKETEQTIAEYAKALGKECIYVDAFMDVEGTAVAEEHYTENGTLLMSLRFDNNQKSRKLNYQCEVSACPAKDFKSYADMAKDKIAFTLTDQTESETIVYQPVQDTLVQGTKLVVDEVVFEKSDLEMACQVKFHYTGTAEEMLQSKDNDICFFLLDDEGKRIKSEVGDTRAEEDGVTMVQKWNYSLDDLPDMLTFQARDVMEGKTYGTVSVKRQ